MCEMPALFSRTDKHFCKQNDVATSIPVYSLIYFMSDSVFFILHRHNFGAHSSLRWYIIFDNISRQAKHTHPKRSSFFCQNIAVRLSAKKLLEFGGKHENCAHEFIRVLIGWTFYSRCERAICWQNKRSWPTNCSNLHLYSRDICTDADDPFLWNFF